MPPAKLADMGDLGTQFGIMNALRTGNVIIDMLVSMVVPLFFQILDFLMEQVLPGISQFIKDLTLDKTVVRKVIEHEVWDFIIRLQHVM
jgi:hypothetical protein